MAIEIEVVRNGCRIDGFQVACSCVVEYNWENLKGACMFDQCWTFMLLNINVMSYGGEG